MSQLTFKLITPERVAYEQQVDQVSLPTVQGEITVLPHHVPLVAMLAAGQILIKTGNSEQILAVSGGLVEVKPNLIVVLADTAEHADEIDEQRAEAAHRRAQELLQSTTAVDAVEYAGLAAKMEKELARLRVARKRSHTRHAPPPESKS